MLDGVYFSSCQLYWRHWIICANDAVVADVGGEAVIGKVSFCSIKLILTKLSKWRFSGSLLRMCLLLASSVLVVVMVADILERGKCL